MVEVADLTERTEDGELLHPLDMRYYNKIISLLPYESVSHVSVLNCMLEQVNNKYLSLVARTARIELYSLYSV